MEIIKIENLTKDYGNEKGIFDVSFTVKKGEVFGFLGPNGAGKTTTIRNIMGFIKADSGKCSINGLDCFNNSSEVQKNIGYIPGEIAFMTGMTGIEFIKFMADYRGLKDLARAYELIKLFNLDIKGKIKKMSKGMKQKLGIVVALMHNPQILILDEPTSGLDPLMQNTFIELIKEEKKKGKTILMSSHMFEEIEKTCTIVSIIKDGRIVAIEDIENLKKTKNRKYTVSLGNLKEVQKFIKEELDIFKVYDNRITVIINNNMNKFVGILNKYDIADIEEEHQSLEDVFMEYYGGEEDD
ncbi:MAG: ABC transporter ATP-binding protein [Clostridia bacterium]|nr:ABC transporter ATP-binding protein [Clostridia bacterium]